MTEPLSSDLGAARTARQRARAEITREIVDTARRHLATAGAAGLSLRAVARDLGMVSSAVYRYFPSRDELLTVLIIESYDHLGDAAEAADAAERRADFLGRWLAICHAVRDWARANPHEYALIYGSPVPGYAAPGDTVPAGTRVPRLLLGLCDDIVAAGQAPEPLRIPRSVRAALLPMREDESLPTSATDDAIVRGLMSWTLLMGAVSLEVFGQFGDVLADPRALFDHEMRRAALA